MPPAIIPMHLFQEPMKVSRTLMPAGQKQAMTGVEIHRPEYHATSIPATQQNLRRFPAQRPHRPQRRKQQQIRLIFCQQHATPWHASDYSKNLSFFSRDSDQDLTRTASVSIYSLTCAIFGVWSGQNNAHRYGATGAPAATGPSTASQSSQTVPVRQSAEIRVTLRRSCSNGMDDQT
jgi:hypothetical protein